MWYVNYISKLSWEKEEGFKIKGMFIKNNLCFPKEEHAKNGCKNSTKLYRMKTHCPGWCGSVDLALDCKLKGCRFNSQSGHMLGWQSRSPVGGVQEATDPSISRTLMFLSFSFSLPSTPSKSEWLKSLKLCINDSLTIYYMYFLIILNAGTYTLRLFLTGLINLTNYFSCLDWLNKW